MCFVVAGVLEMENDQDRDAIRKAKVLYSSCMNESKDLFTQFKHEELFTSGERQESKERVDRNCGLQIT